MVQWCPSTWNVFHDAVIVEIAGTIPGRLRLTLDCDYLRDRVGHPGNRFYVTLTNATRFAYRPWSDDALVIEDLQSVEKRRLWISSAEAGPAFCKVHCNEHIPQGNGGVLEVAASSVHVTLDGDRPITQAELESISEAYWDEWEAQTRHDV